MPGIEARTGLAAWRQVCGQVEGLALGSSLAALLDAGLAPGLLDGVPLGSLARNLGAWPGPLHALVRALALAGWVERRGEPGTDGMTAPLTPRGRAALAASLAYRLVPELLERVERWRRGSGDLARWLELGAGRWGLGRDDPGVEPVQMHLDGHLALPLLVRLRELLGEVPPETPDLEVLGPTPEERRALPGYLGALGWLDPDGSLTLQGRKAWRMAGVGAYPLSYLALIRGAPELLRGDPGWLDRRQAEGREVHVDREADVRFSGEVSLRLVDGPLADLVLPVFDAPDLDRQPRFLVDVGCGDGRMLAALGRAVRERTLRGRHLDSHPLRLLGAEFEEAAARVAAPVLAAEDPTSRVLFGDIADPDGLEARLQAGGASLREALVLAKSVVHNRGLRPPEEPESPREAPSRAAFVDAAGQVVPGDRVEGDLRGLFRRWRPHLRHGMVVAEPHALEEAEAPALVGRNLAAALEYTHALSRQHLVEERIFQRAAREAGLESRGHRATGRQAVGYDSMTFDLFVPT